MIRGFLVKSFIVFSVLGFVGGAALVNDAAHTGSGAATLGVSGTIQFVKGIFTGVQAAQVAEQAPPPPPADKKDKKADKKSGN